MNKHLQYIHVAQEIAKFSKCRRAQYGAIIVSQDGRIVSTGYNGKPRGSCNDDICYREGLEPNSPAPQCCLHAECNAITFCNPLEMDGGTLYVNGICCTNCILKIAQARIAKVYMYIDPNATHRGNFDFAFYEQYGFRFDVTYIYANGPGIPSSIHELNKKFNPYDFNSAPYLLIGEENDECK